MEGKEMNLSGIFGEPEDGSKFECAPTCEDVRVSNMNKMRAALIRDNVITSHFIKCQDGTEEEIVEINPKSKGKYLTCEECDMYYYYVLKNGARITAFRVPSAQVGNSETFIEKSLDIYPQDAEIYQISYDEYFDIRNMVKDLRRTFQRIRRRNIKYNDFRGGD